jgi:hypothetical protein
MQILNIQIEPPASLVKNEELPLWDEFFFPIYRKLYELARPTSPIYPHINFDTFKAYLNPILVALNIDQIKILRTLGGGNKPTSVKEWNKSPENKAMMVFFWNFPKFANLLTNVHLLAPVAVKSSEIYLDIKIDSSNFINAKTFIDEINRQRWPDRPQTKAESQSGVSNLGGVSELLLSTALHKLIDDKNFFKNNNPKVKTYGDFVLMCLPNNLFLSVKSNFARERLLASGYTTDILGVGFFTSKKEFTSIAKIRNFQRVGFLAMYLPDFPVSEEQIASNTNTYSEVQNHYSIKGISLPNNINGTMFLRPLSELHADIKKILAITEIRKRTTLGF